MSDLLTVLNQFDDAIWWIPFLMIIATGLYCTYRFRAVQIAGFGEMIRTTFRHEGGKFSSFRIFIISMGTRVGAGNITGPILAVLVGGPGSIFWMWIFALIGAATCFLETIIGQLYKERNGEDGYNGGTAYNVLHALCRPKFALAIAIIFILMEFVGFASMEACTISETLTAAFNFDGNVVVFSVITTLLLGFAIAGGVKRISDISNVLVPIMVVFWFVICIVSMLLSKGGMLNAFGMIFECAFNVPAAVGGGVGAMLMMGMKRGILSNEAGLGSTPYISSMADVDHPVSQGFTQAFGVLADTVVCTLTALVILSFGSYTEILDTGLESQELLQHVFQQSLGDSAALIVAFFVLIFTFTSMIGTFTIGMSNVTFITKKRSAYIAACILMLAVVFVTAFYASDELYAVVDILLAVTAAANCVVLFLVAGNAFRAFDDYMRQKKEGVTRPKFRKDVLDDRTGVTCWDD